MVEGALASNEAVGPVSGVVRPLGRIAGPEADGAVARGRAWRLAGGEACTHLDVLWRERGSIRNASFTVEAFLARLDGLGAAEQALWRVRLQRLSERPAWPADLAELPLIVGILNVTLDSFHDGGQFTDTGRAIEHGRRLAAEGAAIVDVGGESTRPGARELPVDEEVRRVVPVIRALALDGIYTSIDTRKSQVMARALDAGARMVNDVSALRHDPAAVALLARRSVPIVLMHMRGEPGTMQDAPTYERACFEVAEFLERRAVKLEGLGIERTRLILDPGIGFGKTVEHNLDILRNLDLYGCLGRPVMVGASRKSFIGRLSADEPTAARLPGSLAVNLWGAQRGAHMFRVHDVAATRQALRVWSSLDK